MGKPAFRIDVNKDFCELGDDGEVYRVREDETRELVEDPDEKALLLKAAEDYGLTSQADPLEVTSIHALENNQLTVGNLFTLNESEEEPKQGTARVLDETSIERFGRALTVGNLFELEEERMWRRRR